MGLVSVMPQPCWIQMPCASKARIRLSGTAAPPTNERMPRGSFQRPAWGEPGFSEASEVWISDSQMVGTPSDSVGGSAVIRSSRSSGCRCGPGKTSLAPIITEM